MAAVKRGVAPHTHKQRVLAAISKLRSAFFTGYKKKFARTIYIYITRNVLLSAQMGERASVVLICIITSLYNEVK